MTYTLSRPISLTLALLAGLTITLAGCAKEAGSSSQELISSSPSNAQTLNDACAALETPYREGELVISAMTAPLDTQASQMQGPAMDDSPLHNDNDKESTKSDNPEDLLQLFLKNPQVNFEVFLKTYEEETVQASFKELSNSIQEQQTEIVEPQVLKMTEDFEVATKRISEVAQNVYDSPTEYDKQEVVAAIKSFVDSVEEIAAHCAYSRFEM